MVAPESSLGVFPVGAEWRKLDLNSYSDAGATYETATRSVMDGKRRARKGKQSSREVSFGYNIDMTKSNVAAQVASFLYGKPKEKYTTRSIVAGSILTTIATNPITGMTDTTVTLTNAPAANSLVAGDIFVIEDGVNDRVPLVFVSIATKTITFSLLNATDAINLVGRASDARLVKVGVRAAAADLVLASTATTATLTTTALDFTTMGLSVGEWIFVGGDNTANRFAATPAFYARIAAVSAKVLTFDTTTSPIVADAGAGKSVAIFFGTFITDGDTLSSYTHTRRLGKDDAGKEIVEVFTGCVPNELSINFGESEFVNLDMGYMGIDYKPSSVDTATYNATYAKVKEPTDEEAFHTSTDVYRQRLAVNANKLNTAAITSFVQEGSLSITNNISGDTRQGKIGAFDFSTGDFGLSGSLTAYFVSIDALDAIRCNCTVGMDIILATKNTGSVIDVPAFTMGGSVDVEANTSVKLSLEQEAFSSKFGFVIGYTSFAYLPTIAMPEGTSDCTC